MTERADAKSFVAVDLGASCGRIVRGRFAEEHFEFDEVHRFPNEMQREPGSATLRWSTRELFAQIREGLNRIGRSALSGGSDPRDVKVKSLGVDTWGVDYGLFDGNGRLLEEPIAYRDPRTDGIAERVFEIVSREEIYRATGIQTLPINTLFQLYAHVHGANWPAGAARLLTMPDLFHQLLCGSDSGEYTHATTTQLIRLETRDWDRDLCRRLGIPASILPRLVLPGSSLAPLRPELQRETGLEGCEVVAVATHDTASAVAGTPLSDGVAFISSGSWSLVGVELPEPIVTPESLRENFTNEGGVGGTIRFLKNVTGMWILEGCKKAWREAGNGAGRDLSWDELEREIARAPAWAGVIAPDDPLFFNPVDMHAAVRQFLRETQQPAPEKPGAIARLVLESLALRYADVVETMVQLTGRPLTALRIFGGGSKHDFLNQATADLTGLEVLAGPAEATAIGNLLVQAVAAGRFRDLAEGRAYVAHMLPAKHFVPRAARGGAALLGRFRRIAALRVAHR